MMRKQLKQNIIFVTVTAVVEKVKSALITSVIVLQQQIAVVNGGKVTAYLNAVTLHQFILKG